MKLIITWENGDSKTLKSKNEEEDKLFKDVFKDFQTNINLYLTFNDVIHQLNKARTLELR